MLPHMQDDQIWGALQRNNNDQEKALHELLTTAVQTHKPSEYAAPSPPHTAVGGANYVVYIGQAAGQPPVPAPSYGFHHAPQVSANLNAFSAGAGRRKAVLVGINYNGTRNQLRGCVSDVTRMRQLLMNYYGFRDDVSSMVCLTDDQSDPRFRPTRHNLIYAMKWLVAEARPGDIFFFHFSGHGAQIRDKTGMEADGLDEVILPEDHLTAGPIIDDELHSVMVQPLPSGARLTAVMDCCHSGTGLDLPYTWNASKQRWEEDDNPYFSLGDVQLFSGCQDNQKAADMSSRTKKTPQCGGAMTTAFITAVTQNPHGHTYPSLMQSLQKAMRARVLWQKPQLSSTQRFNINRPFNLTDVVPNHNAQIGRQHRRSKKKKKELGGLLLAGGAGIAAGLLLGEIFG